MRDQPFRLRALQPVERALLPGRLALRRLLADELLALLGVVGRLRLGLGVLDDVLGRDGDHRALDVVAGPPGAPGQLVELARRQVALAPPVVLDETREQDGPDRQVDPDAEGVGAADDRQRAGLRQPLDQPAVAREQAGVVDADPAAQQRRQPLAEALGETGAVERLPDALLALLVEQAETQERLRLLDRACLRRVDDVDRAEALGEQLGDRVRHRRDHPPEVQRHRAFGVVDQGDRQPRAPGQVLPHRRRVAERGAHQQVLGLRQPEQRRLPGPAAVRVAVVVELVERDQADVGVAALAQRQVRQHLGGRADDRGVAVDRRVAGRQADGVGAEDVGQLEELLGDQRLDRGDVPGAPAGREGDEVRAQRDERLAGPRRRREDDVRARRDLEDRVDLVRVQLEPAGGRPLLEQRDRALGVARLPRPRREVAAHRGAPCRGARPPPTPRAR